MWTLAAASTAAPIPRVTIIDIVASMSVLKCFVPLRFFWPILKLRPLTAEK